MLEKFTQSAEKLPSAAEQLSAHVDSLPDNHGIRGQVQIKVSVKDGIYTESGLYNFKYEDGVVSFQAANAEGILVLYTAVAGSVTQFQDEKGGPYEVVFPGFTPQTPSSETATDGVE